MVCSAFMSCVFMLGFCRIFCCAGFVHFCCFVCSIEMYCSQVGFDKILTKTFPVIKGTNHTQMQRSSTTASHPKRKHKSVEARTVASKTPKINQPNLSVKHAIHQSTDQVITHSAIDQSANRRIYAQITKVTKVSRAEIGYFHMHGSRRITSTLCIISSIPTTSQLLSGH